MVSYKIPHSITLAKNGIIIGDGYDFVLAKNFDEVKNILFEDIGEQIDKFFSPDDEQKEELPQNLEIVNIEKPQPESYSKPKSLKTKKKESNA